MNEYEENVPLKSMYPTYSDYLAELDKINVQEAELMPVKPARVCEEDSDKNVIIHWKIGKTIGHGSPTTINCALDYSKKLNKKYGENTHWYVNVKRSTPDFLEIKKDLPYLKDYEDYEVVIMTM